MSDETPKPIDWASYPDGYHEIAGETVRIQNGKPIGIFKDGQLHVYPPSFWGLDDPLVNFPPIPPFQKPKD